MAGPYRLPGGWAIHLPVALDFSLLQRGGDGVFELLLLFSAVVPVGDSGSRTGVIEGEGRAGVGVEKTSSLSELDDGCWAMGEGGWVSLTKQP